jgi:hypothetical protein
LPPPPVRRQRGQSLDRDLEHVSFVVELRPHAPACPPAGDAIEEGLLRRLELDALPEDDDRPPEPLGLVELVFRRLRVPGPDDQYKDVGRADLV